jgi:crossover junction endodeoxyribonuclease RuvC
MIIMGLDPGIARVGWGVIKETPTGPKAIAYGIIETKKEKPNDERLVDIHNAVTTLLVKYKPDSVAIESLFFSTNVKTAMSVGQARGVLLLTCSLKKTATVSYGPMEVKQCITGDGKADKKQVQYMVTRQLHLTQTPKPDDVADALAIALTHAFSYRMKQKLL